MIHEEALVFVHVCEGGALWCSSLCLYDDKTDFFFHVNLTGEKNNNVRDEA